jgi:hypothetical protein
MREDQRQSAYRIRQQDIAPVEQIQSQRVHVVGCGGVNSHFCLLGAKLGLRLTVYDEDTVADENVGSQIFGPGHVGRPKVEVTCEMCEQLAGAQIQAVDAFVSGGEPLDGIVVEAVDSMQARRQVWQEAILPRQELVDALVSVRMGAESGTIVSVRPGRAVDQIWYEINALYPDERAMPVPCTGRATSYCASIAAALAVRAVKRLLMHQPVERRIEFDLTGLMLVVEQGNT